MRNLLLNWKWLRIKGGSGDDNRLCWQDPSSTGDEPAVVHADTKSFCWCCKLGGIINGGKDWKIAQKGLADLELCNNKNGWKKILESTWQSIIFLRRLNMTWWEEKWQDRLIRCPWATKVTRWWKSQIYFKEVLNKAFPGETRECQFHYIKSWWNLSWSDGHHSGHPGSKRVNSHSQRCTGRPQRCSENRKFPCGTAAITISSTWGCGKTLAFLSLIQQPSSQCREDLKVTVYFSLARWGLLSRNTSRVRAEQLKFLDKAVREYI